LQGSQIGQNSLVSKSSMSRIPYEQLSESFNDLNLQNEDIADSEASKIAQNKEVTDSALEKCYELCAFTLDHLHELGQFLSALVQQQEIRESLSEMTLRNIQTAVSEMDLTNHPELHSIDGRLSARFNISSLDVMMATARKSMEYIREIHCSNKSIQASNDQQLEILQEEMDAARKEPEDINRVNQMLEKEICQLKQMMQVYKAKMLKQDEEIVDLKATKNAINLALQQSQKEIDNLMDQQEKLEKKLQTETIRKFQLESELLNSVGRASNLEEKLEEMKTTLEQRADDVEKNWITKLQHEIIVKDLKKESESQAAAMRLEIDALREDAK
jgi:hypothetical protein